MKFKIPISSIRSILIGSLALVAIPVLLAIGCTSGTSTSPSVSPENIPSINTAPSPENPSAALQYGIPLTVTQPENNAITDVSRIEVTGHTSPGAVVSVNEETTTANNKGDFIISITLDEGPNVIDVLASDEGGNEAQVTLVITLAQGG